MHTVRDLLIRKPAKIVMIDPRCTMLQTLLKMGEHGVGALLVADNEGTLAGIVTEHDISKAAAKFGDTLLKQPVGKLMTPDLITCEINDSVVDALVMMSRGRIRHLPVTDDGEVVGMLSVRDMLALCIDAMRTDYSILRQQLADAVWAGGRPGAETWLST